MITKPRFLKTKDGRIALVNVTYEHGEIKHIDGPFQAISTEGTEPKAFTQTMINLLLEALHTTPPIEGYNND